ncbi:MAG: F-type H+-transporting ATPase subunit epsilon [Paracoccaceae bacterium]|jgi:F-type H+-transporting ATPase subunit epsilon
MADMMQFDLVSPERMLASFEAQEIEVPGAEGDFTAMANHAALVTTMRPGVLTVKGASETSEYVVTGGFVEVSATAVSVLAENAVPKADVSRDIVDAMIEAAQTAVSDATDQMQDSADKRLADTLALVDLLGL